MGKESLFNTKTRCDRCGGPLGSYMKSFFTDEILCRQCSEYEDSFKLEMRKRGLNPRDYAGCGYMPDIASRKGDE